MASHTYSPVAGSVIAELRGFLPGNASFRNRQNALLFVDIFLPLYVLEQVETD